MAMRSGSSSGSTRLAKEYRSRGDGRVDDGKGLTPPKGGSSSRGRARATSEGRTGTTDARQPERVRRKVGNVNQTGESRRTDVTQTRRRVRQDVGAGQEPARIAVRWATRTAPTSSRSRRAAAAY